VAQRQQQYGLNELTGNAERIWVLRFLGQFNQPYRNHRAARWQKTLALGSRTGAGRRGAVDLRRQGARGLRLIQVRDLQIDESGLTGKSIGVTKNLAVLDASTPLAERCNIAYAGSLVTFGQGSGIIVATGNQTETGKISQLIEERSELTTTLMRKFNRFSQSWLYMVLFLAMLTFVVGLRQRSWSDAIAAAIALVVGAIPEGLPAVMAITLAVGVSRMAKQHAILRKLPAVEGLGSATVICSDQTGTLTENQMTVQTIYAGEQAFRGTGYSRAGVQMKLNMLNSITMLPPLSFEPKSPGVMHQPPPLIEYFYVDAIAKQPMFHFQGGLGNELDLCYF
jgi:magnesium-transporting ATPase (P-type)